MAYGVEIKNDSGNWLVQDKAPVYVFVGKATYVSLVKFTDEPSSGYEKENTVNCDYTTSTYSVSGTNSYQARIAAWVTSCESHPNGGTTSFSVKDVIGIAEFYIYSPSRPVVFLEEGCVTSIYDTGIVSGGKTKFKIHVLVNYPENDSSGISSMELYCFSPLMDTATSGFGMACFDSSGRKTFDSNEKLMNVVDSMTITALGAAGQTSESGINFTYTGGTMVGVTKPKFLSTDWFRLNIQYRAAWFHTLRYYGGWSCSSRKTKHQAYLDVKGVPSGFSWNGSSVDMNVGFSHKVGIGFISWCPWQDAYGATLDDIFEVLAQTTTPLPLFVPIIDGAEYD